MYDFSFIYLYIIEKNYTVVFIQWKDDGVHPVPRHAPTAGLNCRHQFQG